MDGPVVSGEAQNPQAADLSGYDAAAPFAIDLPILCVLWRKARRMLLLLGAKRVANRFDHLLDNGVSSRGMCRAGDRAFSNNLSYWIVRKSSCGSRLPTTATS